ncbi:MAG: hypothetical protein RLZZ150_123 [Bacteroidota bacterium]|jgi:N-acetylglucosamine kinase-like BadF-type ATPase
MRTVIVDGGGSTTDVAVAINGVIVARTVLPSIKPTPADLHTDELCRMLGTFLASTQISPDVDVTSRLDGVVVGMAGVWSPAEIHRYQLALRDSWETYVGMDVPQLVVMSDAELVMVAAHGLRQGVVLIAGTGSIGLRRMPDGTLQRSGGWGPRIDDAGGGFWLGREACTAVARMLDGRGPSTLLIRPVASYVRADAEDPESVRNGLRRSSIDGVARIGGAVLTYADEGDEVAIALRARGAQELAAVVHALDPEKTCEAMVYGSLFHNAVYHACVEQYADRPLTRIDDVLAAVAASLHG